MGASAGGLRAFQTVLAALPADLPAAVVLVQHRMAEVESRLVELLQRHSRMPLMEPDDKQTLVEGHAFLAPAGYHMLVDKGSLALSVDAPVSFARPSIDVLFQSLAESHAADGAAVVLTGSNDDGAEGALAVRRAGGFVVVEDPESAEAPELPRAVRAKLAPDAVVPLSGVADVIRAWCTANQKKRD